MTTIYKGDSTAIFGNNFLTIRLKSPIPEGFVLSMVKVKIGNLPTITVKDPVFPIKINLTSAQTRQLDQQNTVYMAVWDNYGNKKTCKGKITFVAKDEVVN